MEWRLLNLIYKELIARASTFKFKDLSDHLAHFGYFNNQISLNEAGAWSVYSLANYIVLYEET